jgi:peptide/nickel transport system permease protein
MSTAILARVGQMLVSLFFLLLLVFALVRLTGDPILFLLDPRATAQQEANLRRELGLDESVPVQFVAYIGQLGRGDLGISFRTKRPVADLIAQRVPATVTMGVGAVLLTLLVALPLGVYSAYRRGHLVDRVARAIAALGQSVPDFWLGLLLILVFSVYLDWLPSGGTGGLDHLILPSVTLAFGAIAGVIRLLRSSMIEALASDYVTFLRMKGLPERLILWKHALRNAGLSTLSYLGIVIAGLFTGSVLVETIFNWPGIGLLFIEGIRHRDFGVVQGVMLVFGVAYLGMNLLVDVLAVVLNPRLR